MSHINFEFVWASCIASKLFSNTPEVQIEIGTDILENIGTVKITKIIFQIDYIAAISSVLISWSRVKSLSSRICYEACIKEDINNSAIPSPVDFTSSTLV